MDTLAIPGIQDWVRFMDFGNKAIAFTAETNTVIDQLDIARRPGGKQNIKTAKRLSDISDYRFFTLGPVYMACGIPFDILGEFRSTMEAGGTPYEGPRIVLNFNTPVLGGLQAWDNVLEGIWASPEGYPQFIQYMTTQTIRKVGVKEYWRITYKEVAIPDPMAVDRKEYKLSDPTTSTVIGVFLPSGNHYKVDIAPPTGYPPMALRRLNPDPGVVQEAGIMLNLGTSGEVKTGGI